MAGIDKNIMNTLDGFMISIGRKRAWDVLKKQLNAASNCEEDGCKEAVEQAGINKTNIEANASNINKNANDISDIKDRLDNLNEVTVDSANESDIDNLFN